MAERGVKRICRIVLAAAVVLYCVTGASAAVIGTSERAMSPRPTSQSYGARLEETTLGNYVADAVRSGTGAEIAVVSGGNLVSPLPAGEITSEDVNALFAADLDVVMVEITEEMLYALLEYAVGFIRLDGNEQPDRESGFDGFPQISGFRFEADVSQLAGRRMRWAALEDGTELEQTGGTTVTAALTADMVDGTLGFSMLDGLAYRTAGKQSELVEAYILSQSAVKIPDKGRITLLGFERQTIYESIGVGVWLPYVILLILLLRLPRRKKKRTGD